MRTRNRLTKVMRFFILITFIGIRLYLLMLKENKILLKIN